MKQIILFIPIFFALKCNAQRHKSDIIFDNIPFDLSKGVIDDTTYFDLNMDGKKDAVLKYSYNNFGVKIAKEESGQIIAIYLNKGNNEYQYKSINKSLLALIYNSIRPVNNKTFLVINEGSGQDWNRYYCYISYDENLDEWYLWKIEVYRGYYKKGEDIESKQLIRKKEYTQNDRIPFEKISFNRLFGTLRAEVPEPSYYEKIKVSKSYILTELGKRTDKYLVIGDEVEIVKEKDGLIKIRYYGKKNIEGWIKKTDVK